MNTVELITKKRNGEALANDELEYLVYGYTAGDIPDYQMSAFLMAVYFNGMDKSETVALTQIMRDSGDTIDLTGIEGIKVDKHSTGGVGDKTTLIVGPIAAACGVPIAKMSGRGLGHTGGTVDKLESFEGYNTELSPDEFAKQVESIGIALVGQSGNLTPADKMLYALRDVTATVDSIPLIASSIMSKKIASGANKLVIDVKVGKGALIKTKKDAKKLARLMINIGKANGIEVVCLLTNMDIPLGNNIGNALEVKEVISVLTNKSFGNLRDICIELSSYMVSLGLGISYKEAKNMVIDNLYDGKAYLKFLELVSHQNGGLDGLVESKNTYQVKSTCEGYLTNIDALALGNLSSYLGAGRKSLSDELDYGAGIIINKNIGDYIKKGDVLMTLYTNKELEKKELLSNAFKIEKENKEKQELIYEVIR